MNDDNTTRHKNSGPDVRNTHSIEDLYPLYDCMSALPSGGYNYDQLKGNAAHRPPVIGLTNGLCGPNAIINCIAGDNSYGT